MHSSTHCKLPIHSLATTATRAYTFPDLRQSLLSIPQLCNDDCQAIFDKHQVVIKKENTNILTGKRDYVTGLWTIDLQQQSNNIIQISDQSDLVQYLHAACFSPTTATLVKAIKNGHFVTWPGLTVEAVLRHLPKSEATIKGHMDQRRKNILSTRPKAVEKTLVSSEQILHSLHRGNIAENNKIVHTIQDDDHMETIPAEPREHHLYAAIVTHEEITGQIYTDLTGRFPQQSSHGNKYILVLYDYDSNAILAHPIKNRSDTETLQAYETLIKILQQRGLTPKLQRLDNEASKALKTYLHDQQIEFQLVPPHVHRRNAAERAIRTFKNHFIAGLCSTDKLFPMHLWDRLIDQATITLNLLRTSRINPRLSAYAQLYGAFDFNSTPMAPPGTRVLAHEKPEQRTTWAPHSIDGWYVGPAMQHYRCYRIHTSKTQSERICDTVEFFPTHVTMPRLSSADAATRAAQDLIHALRHPAPASPFQVTEDRLASLKQLAEIFDISQRNAPAAPRVEKPAASPILPEPTFIPHRYPTRHRQQANAVIDEITGKELNYKKLISNPETKEKWLRSSANEFGRLAQGLKDRVTGTDTIMFIRADQVPKGSTVTYGRFVCDVRPHKDETERTRLTVGGNLINYPYSVSTKTADLTTTKLLFNSVVSTPNAKYMCMDVKNFYLNSPMPRYEYMKIPVELIPAEIMTAYNLHEKVHNGYVYIEIQKGMYGLPQAGLLANQLLAKRLAKFGYYQATHTHGLWKHTWRPIQFTLVVDDFGVMYVGKEHADHLADALRQHYQISVDWKGELYCGMTLKWNYEKRTVDISMPEYIMAVMHKYQHPTPTKPENAPHKSIPINYGLKQQMTQAPSTASPLSADRKKNLQQIIGSILYYARAVDNTMLMALSALASAQAHATEDTAKALVHFLNYCTTHPDATIRYLASDMVLHVHSDASYLSEPQARSRAGGHFFMANKIKAGMPVLNNGAILNVSTIIRNVMSSAAEAELAALFTNAKEATVLRTTLTEMGHPQPVTPIQVDNSTADGIANETVKQQRSKAIDMRFYWIRDRIAQNQFYVYWAPGKNNLADYFTKHHPAPHHQAVRKYYLHTTESKTHLPQVTVPIPPDLRGCVDTRQTKASGQQAKAPRVSMSNSQTYQRKPAQPITCASQTLYRPARAPASRTSLQARPARVH
jgi:hypothetical protein